MRFLQYTGANKILKTYLLHQCKKDYQMYLKAKKWQNTQEKIDLRIKKRYCEKTPRFLIARLARSDPRNHFSVQKKLCAIYSILVYFIMFSFQVLTCLRIVSIRIILNLNKFRKVGTCSDMFENCNNSCHIESEQVYTYLIMFRHVWELHES